MANNIVKITACVVALTSCFVVLFTYFVKIFYVNEEILDIPILEANKNPVKLSPGNKDQMKNELDFKILHGNKITKDEKKLILKKNEPELVPFDFGKKNNEDNKLVLKKIDNDKSLKNQSKKKKTIKNPSEKSNLKKYRVQLGSFKNKDKAIKAITDIKNKFYLIFKNHELEIYSIEKENYTFHRVWTNLMFKIDALDLCNELKKIKVNCILQIDEG